MLLLFYKIETIYNLKMRESKILSLFHNVSHSNIFHIYIDVNEYKYGIC